MKIRYRAEAIADIVEACAYCRNQDGQGAEEAFLRRLARTVVLLREAPHRWPAGDRGIRRIRVDPTPYSIFYRISEDTIDVFTLFHGSMDPGEVVRRLRRER